jgi:predicted GNAT family N-acyltransferase
VSGEERFDYVGSSILDMKFEVVDEFDSKHTAEFRDLYDQYPWWEDRSSEDVQTMIEHTDLLVGLRNTENGHLVAAGRVLTDFVYYAKIYDVIVAKKYRGDGLGQQLMGSIVDHHALSSLSTLTLDCRDGLIPFYEDCGFERNEMEAVILEEREQERERRREDLVPMVYHRD